MIAAIVLAAGQSRRMGQPKLLLPWKDTTVLEHVLATLKVGSVDRRLVVTGHAGKAIQEAVRDREIIFISNDDYAQGEMLSSIQCGLRALGEEIEAALIVLGDQPQLRAGTVQAVLGAYRETRPGLVVPSHSHRRGHPWLADRALWPALLALSPAGTPREFLQAQADLIRYVEIADDSILRDIDTPEEYQRERDG